MAGYARLKHMMSSRYDYDDDATFAAWEARDDRLSEQRAQAQDEAMDYLYSYAESLVEDSDSYDEARGVAALILDDSDFSIVDDILRSLFGEDEV